MPARVMYIYFLGNSLQALLLLTRTEGSKVVVKACLNARNRRTLLFTVVVPSLNVRFG